MKKLYKYSILLMAAFLFVPFTVNAQSAEDVIGLNKTVKPNDDGSYTITLETFVTGGSVTTVTDVNIPCDIALVLDYSNSMYSNYVGEAVESEGTQVTGGNLSRNTVYYIKINGVNYYLSYVANSGQGRRWWYSTSNPPTATNGTLAYQDGANSNTTPAEILNAVPGATGIYNIVTTRKTRAEAMIAAAKEFVETVYANNPTTGAKHRIGVIGFAGRNAANNADTGPMIDVQLTELTNETVKNTVKDGIVDHEGLHGTFAFDGLGAAYDMLKNSQGRQIVTVFFTDGQPNEGSGFTGFSTRTREAVHYSDQLKELATQFTYHDNTTDQDVTLDLTSKVYSVAVLSQSDANNTQMIHFLNYVSSNYKTGMTEGAADNGYNFSTDYPGAGGGSEGPHDYFQMSDGSDLTAIFRSIASSASSGGASYQLSTTSVVTVDIVSSRFMLPPGANASSIKVYTEDFKDYTSKTDKSTYEFENKTLCASDSFKYIKTTVDGVDKLIAVSKTTNQPLPEGVIGIGVGKTKTGQDSIAVSNFDFSANWCGYNEVEHGSSTVNEAHGKKLVIEIPIVVDVQNPGGTALETNAPGSGIYVNGEALIHFPIPSVNLPNIIIRKYGLLYKGEGASFLLEKLNDDGTAVDTSVDPYRIVVVATDDNPNTFDFVQVKLNEPGRYRVTETDWGWSYICTAGNGTATPASGMEEDDTLDPDRTLKPTVMDKNGKNQPYIDRDVSGDTEQTITLPGGSTLAGAVYDFHNESKKHEKRNYSEAHKLNEFNTVYNQ